MFDNGFKKLLDAYGHTVYAITRSFPKEEMFGITSQLRRASLSVALNCIEGYARQRPAVYKQFLETAYGSLKESRYLLEFSREEKFISDNDYLSVIQMADRLGAIIWTTIQSLNR